MNTIIGNERKTFDHSEIISKVKQSNTLSQKYDEILMKVSFYFNLDNSDANTNNNKLSKKNTKYSNNKINEKDEIEYNDI